jgi:hypothetical protein
MREKVSVVPLSMFRPSTHITEVGLEIVPGVPHHDAVRVGFSGIEVVIAVGLRRQRFITLAIAFRSFYVHIVVMLRRGTSSWPHRKLSANEDRSKTFDLHW